MEQAYKYKAKAAVAEAKKAEREAAEKKNPVPDSGKKKMDIEAIDSDRLFDTGVAAYLLESDRSSFDINGLVELYFGSELPEPTDAFAHSQYTDQNRLPARSGI